MIKEEEDDEYFRNLFNLKFAFKIKQLFIRTFNKLNKKDSKQNSISDFQTIGNINEQSEHKEHFFYQNFWLRGIKLILIEISILYIIFNIILFLMFNLIVNTKNMEISNDIFLYKSI